MRTRLVLEHFPCVTLSRNSFTMWSITTSYFLVFMSLRHPMRSAICLLLSSFSMIFCSHMIFNRSAMRSLKRILPKPYLLKQMRIVSRAPRSNGYRSNCGLVVSSNSCTRLQNRLIFFSSSRRGMNSRLKAMSTMGILFMFEKVRRRQCYMIENKCSSPVFSASWSCSTSKRAKRMTRPTISTDNYSRSSSWQIECISKVFYLSVSVSAPALVLLSK